MRYNRMTPLSSCYCSRLGFKGFVKFVTLRQLPVTADLPAGRQGEYAAPKFSPVNMPEPIGKIIVL
jgi:hypothetical protein